LRSNIKPLLAIDMPNCFGHQQPYSCNQSAADSVTYVEVSGIIVGMLALGFCADIIGRKWGSRLASSTMLVGSIMLTACAGSDPQFLAIFLTALFVLGAGVGGEYPVASSSAAEKAEGSKAMRRRRGERVVLVFSQQGWGNLANTLCIVLLLVMQGATGEEVTERQASITWRVQFAVGTAICLGVVAYRWTLLQESKVWKAERHDVAEQLAQKGLRKHHSQQEYRLVIRYYWPRVFATSLSWALGGFAFFGQKLFQAQFIKLIVPGATLLQQMLYILLNNGVALVGYYCAAFSIDRPWCGRMRMQAGGFFMLFLLFLLQGALFDTLTQHSGAFQLLYYLSSFFAQLGPNCTTFLTAGEVYPTGVRSFFHGISAAAGKVGALVAAVLFSNISPRAAFFASAGAGLGGLLVTLGFLPDTTGLDLHEIDRMNRYLLADQYPNYRGEAVNPRYLSLYERWRRYDAHYHPEADYAHKELQLHPHLQEAAESLASLSRQASLASIRLSPGSPSSVRLSLFGRPSSVQLTPRSPKPPSSARLGRPASVQLTPVSFELQLTPVATRPPSSAGGQRSASGQHKAPSSSAHPSQRSPRNQRQE
jgi:MFS family permease